MIGIVRIVLGAVEIEGPGLVIELNLISSG